MNKFIEGTDTCPECGLWNDAGKKKLRDHAKENPIYYRDNIKEFKKPLSVLIEDLRSDLSTVRGKLCDIKRAHGWDEFIEPAEGGLTCIISTLYHTYQDMEKFERKTKEKE